MTHLTREQLERWSAEGAAGDREGVFGHLASCEACRREYAELVRLPAPAATSAPPLFDPRDFVARGRAAYDGANARGFRWRPAWTLLPAAAAAALAVALLVPREAPPVRDSPLEVRGSTLQPLAPVGDVTSVTEFKWASPFAAARYRVSVKDAAGKTVLSLESAAERVPLAPDAAQRLSAGRHTWAVEALDASGRVIGTSPPRSFTLVR